MKRKDYSNGTLVYGMTREEIETMFMLVKDKLDQLTRLVIPPAQEDLMSPKETAKFFGVDQSTIYLWRKRGFINSYSLGGRIYYKRNELLSALQVVGKDAVLSA